MNEVITSWLYQGNGGIQVVLGVYRYSSWFLTSLFYLLGPPSAPYAFKLGVVLCLLLAGGLAHLLYLNVGQKSAGFVQSLAALETLGIVLLLLPTGGIGSPFIWYAINPILVTAAELPWPWCWGVLAEFLAGATVVTVLLGSAISELYLDGHSYLLLIFLLLTLSVQLLTRLVKKTQRQAGQIEAQRAELERSWELLSTLYRLVELVSGQEGVQEVLELLAGYSLELARAQKVVIWLGPDGDAGSERWATAGPDALYPREQCSGDLRHLWPDLRRDPSPVEKGRLAGEAKPARAVYLPIRSANRSYGIFCTVYSGPESIGSINHYTLKFLADFTAVALERARIEELNRQLLLAEEQNRIAGEIHDGVAQYLFSIACGCHSLREGWERLESETVREQLDLLTQTARSAAQELRASIYRLSPQRQGEEVFIEGVRTYLKELASLNGIQTDLIVEGSEEVLSPALRKAFYRIIREASGNAIRHGGCRSLRVRLRLAPAQAVLEVEDDGCGWRPEVTMKNCRSKGLGLRNMQHLAASFNGGLEIESVPGRGTVVRCTVPKTVTLAVR